jgi:hypothetical protein
VESYGPQKGRSQLQLSRLCKVGFRVGFIEHVNLVAYVRHSCLPALEGIYKSNQQASFSVNSATSYRPPLKTISSLFGAREQRQNMDVRARGIRECLVRFRGELDQAHG